jgi:hypothetical protein
MLLLLYPRGKTPKTHRIGGWVGHRASLDTMENWKFLTLSGLELWRACLISDFVRLVFNSLTSRDSTDEEGSESEDSSGAEPSVETGEASEITMSCGSTVVCRDEKAIFLKKQSKSHSSFHFSLFICYLFLFTSWICIYERSVKNWTASVV